MDLGFFIVPIHNILLTGQSELQYPNYSHWENVNPCMARMHTRGKNAVCAGTTVASLLLKCSYWQSAHGIKTMFWIYISLNCLHCKVLLFYF